MPSIIVEKSELFISLEFAVEFLNSSFGNVNIGDRDTLGPFLTTYIPVSGLFFIFPSKNNEGNINPKYLNGLCKAEYFNESGKCTHDLLTKKSLVEGPCIVKTCNFSDWENPNDEQELLVKPCGKIITNNELYDNAMIQVKELAQFVEETNFPIDEQCFFTFFDEAHKVLKESYLVTIEHADDKEAALREHYFFDELIAAFGEQYVEMIEGSTDVAIWFIMHAIEERKIIMERAQKLVEAGALQAELKQVEIKDNIYNEEDVPNLLFFAYNLFDEAWRDLPPNMNKPSKTQLIELLNIKGITETATIDAIIKVSTPNGVVLGGRKKPGFIEWKPKIKRI